MRDPLAFLLTFRTYGTWMHGNDRGSVDCEHNIPGTPLLPPDEERETAESAIMTHSPLILTAEMRSVVDAALVDECAYRRWQLLERAVRTNHVHIVIGYAGLKPQMLTQKLKARSTRWLRERALVSADQPVWVDRPGSRRHLWTDAHIKAACAYVLDGQDVPR